jgi:hypothetical protein
MILSSSQLHAAVFLMNLFHVEVFTALELHHWGFFFIAGIAFPNAIIMAYWSLFKPNFCASGKLSTAPVAEIRSAVSNRCRKFSHAHLCTSNSMMRKWHALHTENTLLTHVNLSGLFASLTAIREALRCKSLIPSYGLIPSNTIMRIAWSSQPRKCSILRAKYAYSSELERSLRFLNNMTGHERST